MRKINFNGHYLYYLYIHQILCLIKRTNKGFSVEIDIIEIKIPILSGAWNKAVKLTYFMTKTILLQGNR